MHKEFMNVIHFTLQTKTRIRWSKIDFFENRLTKLTNVGFKKEQRRKLIHITIADGTAKKEGADDKTKKSSLASQGAALGGDV